MKQRILSIVLCLLVCISFMPSEATAIIGERNLQATCYAQGAGTADNPWLIRSLEDLEALSAEVQNMISQENCYFKLVSDIGSKDSPVNISVGGFDNYHFKGTFDGGGHIVWLEQNVPNSEFGGLFCTIAEEGTIKNLIVAGSITAKGQSGGICGQNNGKIINCAAIVDVTVTGEKAGGICGYNNGQIIHCYCSGTISAADKYSPVCYPIPTTTTDPRPIMKSYYSGSEIVKINGASAYPIGQMKTKSYEVYNGADRQTEGKAFISLFNVFSSSADWTDGCYPWMLNENILDGLPSFHIHDNVTFEKMWSSETALPTEAGIYVLSKDVTLSDTWTVPEGVTDICLNGYVINANGSQAITIPEGSTLNLYDCVNEAPHQFTSSGGLLSFDESGAETILGGLITGGKATTGGGVYVCGTLNVYGGSIVGNTANSGGGVYVEAGGAFNMYGGTIKGNKATENGGGVMLSGNMTVGGTTVIRGNHTESISESNIHLENNSKDSLRINTEIPLTSGADIGVTVYQDSASGWGPSFEVGDYFGDTMTEPDCKYFVMNNGHESGANKGTVYNILKSGGKYILAKAFTISGYTDDYGSVTAGKETYLNGETVVLCATANTGYVLKSLTAKPISGSDITPVQDQTNISNYTFTMPAANVTVAAVFEPMTAVINLEPNGGSGGTTSVTASYGSAMPSAIMPVKTGYSFDGYFDAESDGIKYYNIDGSSAKTWDKTETVATLYACWLPNQYAVSFDKNGGDTAPDPININEIFDAKYNLPTTDPTRTGFTFAGWFTESEGGVQVTTDTVVKITTETALYAHWRENAINSDTGKSSNKQEKEVTLKDGSMKVEASVSGNTATIKEISDDVLNKAINDNDFTGIIEIELPKLNREINTIKIPTDTIEKVAHTGNDTVGISIKLTTAEVTFDAKAIQEISEQAGGDVIQLVVENRDVSLTEAQKEAIDELDTALIIDAYLVSGGNKICSEANDGFAGGKATVYLPYSTTEQRNAANYSVYYLSDDGRLEKINTIYDKLLGAFVFDLTHLSNYVIVYDENACAKDNSCPVAAFSDTKASAWYHDGVHYCLSESLMVGYPDGTFRPSDAFTRAQIVAMLYRMAGLPEITTSNTFNDVKVGSWYADAVSWASTNNIVNGVGSGLFAPDTKVTREQLASILYRYAVSMGVDTAAVTENTNTLSAGDIFTVSSWANEGVHYCIAAGILGGDANGNINPKAFATRAEAASMFQRFNSSISTK